MDNTVFSGKNNSILIGWETSGTVVAATKTLGYVQDGSIEETEDKERVGSIGARNAQHHVRTRFRVRGTIDGAYQHARPLYATLGAVTHSATVQGWQHTITEADVLTPMTISAAKSFTSTARLTIVNEARANSYKITAEKGTFAKWTMDWIGVSATVSSTVVAQTLDTNAPPSPPQMAVYIGADSANPTSELTTVQTFECTINNSLETLEQLNAVTISEAVEQDRIYTGRISIAASLATQTANALNQILGTTSSTTPANTQTKSAIKLVYQDAVSTPTNALTLTLYGVTYDSMTDPYTRNGIMYVDIPFTATRLGSCISNDAISDTAW